MHVGGGEGPRVLQVEVSTRCSFRCVMCPRTIFATSWVEKDMSPEVFERAISTSNSVEYVHLQGWGEPLQNPHIFEMVRMAKARGAEVGITTNALLISERVVEKLVEAGLDRVTISVAGATREVHERVRVGSNYWALLNSIELFRRVKRARGRPTLALNLLMTKQNIYELPALVDLAGQYDVDEVIAMNLDYVPIKQLEDKAVFVCSGRPSRDYVNAIKSAKRRAERLGVTFADRMLSLFELTVCPENPLESTFITVDGMVAPCVYLHLPTSLPYIPRVFCGVEHRVDKLYFGNVLERGVDEIWSSEKYRSFREFFAARRKIEERIVEIPPFRVSIEYESWLREHPLPEPCRTCYKAFGI